MSAQVLIVDDEPDIRELLKLTLTRMQLDCQVAADLAEARQLLDRHPFNLCLTDMRLPDGEGIELVEHIQRHHPDLPVAVITAYGGMQIAIDSLKAGAFDFMTKPVDLDKLRQLVSNALHLRNHEDGNGGVMQNLIGESQPMQQVRQMITKLARSQAPVLITGESGTGKEMAARLIHAHGPRSAQPFVAVNCGAIPSELMESEFFGYKKGSFTGADSDKQGLFQAANGGTLFLDEVAELPLNMQVKLLRAIQERAVRPVGAAGEVAIDVRILSATNKDLQTQVDQQAFRHDLYFRLNVIELPLPPLRQRKGDIRLLAEHIIARLPHHYPQQPTFSNEALATLAAYPFPGNIRELENTLERALALSESHVIHTSDLNLTVIAAQDTPSNEIPERGDIPLEDYLASIETRQIRLALQQCGGNRAKTAKYLGLSPRQLRYRMTKLGIED